MADAVHEVLVNLVADGFLLLEIIVLCHRGDCGGVALSGEGTVDELAGLFDRERLGDAHGNHGLASEALSLNVFVGGDNDGARRGDFAARELVLDANLAVGLDLDGEPAFGSCLLERLLRHEGMRDARWATGGRDDVVLCHAALLSNSRRLSAEPYGNTISHRSADCLAGSRLRHDATSCGNGIRKISKESIDLQN